MVKNAATTSQWLYLGDVTSGGNVQVMRVDTGEKTTLSINQIEDRAPIGLRGYLLERNDSTGMYRETGEQAAMTEELWDELTDAWRGHNSWIADWPHFQLESSVSPSEVDAMRQKLLAQTVQLPYEFEIVGLQRRWLLYFSDGDFSTQQYFDRAIPWPDRLPYRRNGELRQQFQRGWDHAMRDAKAPKPQFLQNLSLRPCMYAGPAWVVRVKLNGVVPQVQNCRMYVDDDGTFLASDWCQRQDFHTYGSGINLQVGLYNFASWLIGPCLVYAQSKAHLVVPHINTRQVRVRDVMKNAMLMPTFEEAMQLSMVELKQSGMKFPEVRIEPGPITEVDVAEAFKLMPAILEKTEQRIKMREADCTLYSQLATIGDNEETPTELPDIIPGWRLIIVRTKHTKKYSNTFPDLATLVVLKEKGTKGKFVELTTHYAHVRAWPDLTPDMKVKHIRMLRQQVLGSMEGPNAILNGVYYDSKAQAVSDSGNGKATPGTYTYSETDLSQALMIVAVNKYFSTATAPASVAPASSTGATP